MIILIFGSTHTGKTLLAHQLMKQLKFSVLSQDHLKMGLIRSGQTDLTPMDDEKLLEYLWPITREIIKTVIENQQNLIIEGCYIPFDWKQDFDETYLKEIQCVCLVMSENYLRNHEKEILEYGNLIEHRIENSVCIKQLMDENRHNMKMCRQFDCPFIVIDEKYDVFEQSKGLFQKDKSDTMNL